MSDKPVFRRWQSWAILIFIILFVWGLAREVNAAEVRIGLGAGVTNDNDWIGQAIELSNRDWYVSALRVGNDDRQPDTWRIAAGWRVDWREDKKVAPFLRLGAAYWLDEPAPLISDRLSYDMALGARFWRVMDVELQHNSTAGRTDFNKGNDMIFLHIVLPIR